MEYFYRRKMLESVKVQQKAARSTRSFVVLLGKARNKMLR